MKDSVSRLLKVSRIVGFSFGWDLDVDLASGLFPSSRAIISNFHKRPNHLDDQRGSHNRFSSPEQIGIS